MILFSRPLRSSAVRWTLMSLTSVVLSAGVSQESQAGCSHRVSSAATNRYSSVAASLQIFAIGKAGGTLLQNGAPWAPRPDQPCSGPGCRRRSSPSEAPARLMVSATENLCLCLAQTPSLTLATDRRRPDEPHISPSHTSPSIERPPRNG